MEANEHIANAAKAIALAAAEETKALTKTDWNDAKSQVLGRLSNLEQEVKSINTLLKDQEKMRRIEFAVEQINLELTRNNGYLSQTNYYGRSSQHIKNILFAFRQGRGYYIIKIGKPADFHTKVQDELYELLGVKPRLEQKKDQSGDMQWAVYYS